MKKALKVALRRRVEVEPRMSELQVTQKWYEGLWKEGGDGLQGQ